MIGRVNGGGVNIDFVNATADKILAPYKGADPDGEPVIGTIPTKTASDLSASGKTVTVPAGYYASLVTKDVALGTITGSGSVAQSAPTFSLSGTTVTASVAAKTGTITPSVTAAGYVSSSEGTKTNGTFSLTANSSTYTIPTETRTVTPSTSAQTISRSTNTFITSVTVNAIPNLKSASDLSASGKTVTVPAGYYASLVTKDVATGSATTPATTKAQSTPSISIDSAGKITASVAATSVSVTPTVSAGYVSSGTAGTVTMSASSNTKLMTTGGGDVKLTSTTTSSNVAASTYLTSRHYVYVDVYSGG